MLIPTQELVRDAQANHYALGAFNVYNLELVKGVLRGAECAHAPIILQLGAGQLQYGGYESLVALGLGAARAAAIPVALHLDHGTQLSDIQRALNTGFSSVMIDGSKLPFRENVMLTQQAAMLAHASTKLVEAELGHLAGAEDAAVPVKPTGEMTNPEEAARFVEATRVDLLAVCIGNVHGFYTGQPRLDLARLEAIRHQTTAPLVLHGTSGLSDPTIKALVAHGVVKFNFNTELRIRFFDTLRMELDKPHPTYDLRQLMNPVMDAIAELVARKLELLGSAARG